MELRQYCPAKSAVDIWTLLVKDAASEIKDGQNVMHEGHAVNDGFRDLGLNLLEVVLWALIVLHWAVRTWRHYLVSRDEQVEKVVEHPFLLQL